MKSLSPCTTIGMAVLMACSHSYAKICGDDIHPGARIGFRVYNYMKNPVMLDMGVPVYGTVSEDNSRETIIFPHGSARVYGCNDRPLTGFQSYIRLYEVLRENKRYLLEWYIKMPFLGASTITFTPDTQACQVYWQHHSTHNDVKLKSWESFHHDRTAYIKVYCGHGYSHVL